MQAQTVTHADTVSDALGLSIAEKARVDMPYMAELTGKIPCGGGFFVFMATTRIIPMHKNKGKTIERSMITCVKESPWHRMDTV